MQVSVEDPDVLVWLIVVVDAAAVVVVVAAVGWYLPCSAAAVGVGSAATGGCLNSTAVVVDASGEGSCLLPSAAWDGKLRFAAKTRMSVTVLSGCLDRAVAGLTYGLLEEVVGNIEMELF